MASQTFLPTSVTVVRAWDDAWNDETLITIDDGNPAVVGVTGLEVSDDIAAWSFGFSIPPATINGIMVETNDATVGTASIFLTLSKDAVSIAGSGKFAGSASGWWAYGDATDLWSTTWTPAEINDPNFGVIISASGSGGGATTVSLDAIRITVYYTATGPPPQTAYPSATVAAGSWAAVGDSSLHEAVDATGGDTDYAESPVATSGGHETKLRLAALTDPNVGSGHVLKYRYAKSALAGDVVNLVVTLYRADGTTVVATTTVSAIGAVTDGSFTLTSTEANSIPSGDYATGLVLGLKEVKV